jgi:hypothetical protein
MRGSSSIGKIVKSVMSNNPDMRVTRRGSTRKLGARLSPHLRALVDRFAKSRDGGFDHSVLSWAVPLMERMLKAKEFGFAPQASLLL